jgi:hypothetical protein
MKEKTLKQRIKEMGYMLGHVAKEIGESNQNLTWALSKKRKSKKYKGILLKVESFLNPPSKE